MSPEMPISSPESLAAPTPFLAAPSKAAVKARRLLQQAVQGLTLLACAVLSYYLISHYLVQSVRVVGSSMIPTLQDSRFYLLNRWVLHVRGPHRAEIVVLRDPLDGGFAVKRIIGTPGDSVYLADGVVYINGQKALESYLPKGTMTFTFTNARAQLFKCQPGQYFVLGDNRGNSLDSRSYGPVSRRDILGLIIR